jgi:hypothetical protein
VEFTVTQKGPTLDALIRGTTRDLRAANRTAGRDVAKVGKAAMAKGAPHMFGKALTVKTKVDAWPTRCAVEFNPARGQAGPWQIAETGRRGGYTVKPRRRKALAFAGRFAMVTHPGPVGGHKAWTRAVQRGAKAVGKQVGDVYDDALGAG